MQFLSVISHLVILLISMYRSFFNVLRKERKKIKRWKKCFISRFYLHNRVAKIFKYSITSAVKRPTYVLILFLNKKFERNLIWFSKRNLVLDQWECSRKLNRIKNEKNSHRIDIYFRFVFITRSSQTWDSYRCVNDIHVFRDSCTERL